MRIRVTNRYKRRVKGKIERNTSEDREIQRDYWETQREPGQSDLKNSIE